MILLQPQLTLQTNPITLHSNPKHLFTAPIQIIIGKRSAGDSREIAEVLVIDRNEKMY